MYNDLSRALVAICESTMRNAQTINTEFNNVAIIGAAVVVFAVAIMAEEWFAVERTIHRAPVKQ